MATSKVTFTLDRETLTKLADSASRVSKPKSQVVREAIADYHARIGRLSEAERRHMLDAFDAVVPAIPARPLKEVESELDSIRGARHAADRRTRRKTGR